jgi:hypothetical protein
MAFPYSSLQSDRQEIRLLTLRPGDEGDPIPLGIETTSLGLTGDYTCLSYAWGPPGPNCAGELSGHSQLAQVRYPIGLGRQRLARPDRPD